MSVVGWTLQMQAGHTCGWCGQVNLDFYKWISAGTTGIIKSFNYAGGYHLTNQQYTSCIR